MVAAVSMSALATVAPGSPTLTSGWTADTERSTPPPPSETNVGVSIDWDEETMLTYHPDHLGSSVLISSDNGRPYYRSEMKPYGEMHQEWRAGDPAATAEDPPGTGSGQPLVNHLFTGYERDFEMGYDYAQARYYDPEVARFMAVDPMVMTNMDLSKGRSRSMRLDAQHNYLYSGSRPVMAIDPMGQDYFLVVQFRAYIAEESYRPSGVGVSRSWQGDNRGPSTELSELLASRNNEPGSRAVASVILQFDDDGNFIGEYGYETNYTSSSGTDVVADRLRDADNIISSAAHLEPDDETWQLDPDEDGSVSMELDSDHMVSASLTGLLQNVGAGDIDLEADINVSLNTNDRELNISGDVKTFRFPDNEGVYDLFHSENDDIFEAIDSGAIARGHWTEYEAPDTGPDLVNLRRMRRSAVDHSNSF